MSVSYNISSEPKSSSAHLAHIALSEPMANIHPAGLKPRLVPDLPLPIKKTLCQVLSGGKQRKI